MIDRNTRLACLLAAFSLGLFALNGCGVESKPNAADDHDHADHDHADHDHDGDTAEHAGEHDHHSGVVVDLGTVTVNDIAVRASYDGEVTPGDDVPVDAWIDGGAGGVSSVRFWIGLESAEGSVKARADLDGDHWHVHVEVPSPLPDGSKLWIDFEKNGTATVAGFDLKP